MAKPQSQLADILLRAGLVTQDKVDEAYLEQRQWGGNLAPMMVEMGFLREEQLVQTLSQYLRLPIATLDGMRQIAPEALQRLPVPFCERFDLMPIGLDPRRNLLQVAMSDPSDTALIGEIRKLAGMEVEIFVAGTTSIRRAIRIYFYGESTAEVLRIVPDAWPDPNQTRSYVGGPPPTGEFPQSRRSPPSSYPHLSKVPSVPPSQRSATANYSAFPSGPPTTPARPAPSFRPATTAQAAFSPPPTGGYQGSFQPVTPSQSSLPQATYPPPSSPSLLGLPPNQVAGNHFPSHSPVDRDLHYQPNPPADTSALERRIQRLETDLQQALQQIQAAEERSQNEIKELQQMLRSRLQEQRQLLRGLFDLLADHRLISREEILQLLSSAAQAK